MADFRQLKVWQKAHELTLKIYQITNRFPREELYGLTSQIRRASVSVASNIAEGDGRYHKSDKLKFFIDSRSSINEVKAQLLIAGDLYSKLSKEVLGLFDNYGILERQLNKLITYRRSHGK